MKGSLQRVVCAYRSGGSSQAGSVIRHGLRWRTRVARDALARKIATPPDERPALMRSEGSIASATSVLRSIAATHPEIKREQIGPPLRVAVVVPTHRDTAFLGSALASVQQQTYPRWHCYVVDDASPEDVDSVVAPFLEDDRFTLVRHAANGGLAAARNTAIRLINEDAVQFLDADDMLTAWSIERRVADLRRHWYDPMVAGVYGEVFQCTEETAVEDMFSWSSTFVLSDRDWIASEGECPFAVNAPLTKTSLMRQLGGFDESFVNGAEDWELWHRVLRHGFVFKPTQAVVAAYRQRHASMIRRHDTQHLDRADEMFRLAGSWVQLDAESAGSNAMMPIGDAQIALKRVLRAAAWAGIRAARSGSVSEALSPEIFAFLRPEATVGTRWSQVSDSAWRGVIRGLGLSAQIINEMPEDAKETIAAVASSITAELKEHVSRDTGSGPASGTDLRRRWEADVVLVSEAASDLDVMAPLLKELVDRGLLVEVVDPSVLVGAAGVADAWRGEGVKTRTAHDLLLGTGTCRVILTRFPCHPCVQEVLQAAISNGSRAAYVHEPDRGLILDEALEFMLDLSHVDLTGVLDLLASDAQECTSDQQPDPPSLPLVPHATLIASEENHLDEEGHVWLAAAKNRFRGQTVVIIGNGPSLNNTDLALLSGQHAFGVNSIFLASERLPGPLTYYVVEDTAVFNDNMVSIKAYSAENKLFPTLYRRHFLEEEIGDNTHFFRMNQGFYGRSDRHGRPTRTCCLPRFSMDASQRVYCGQSVTMINLQLAHWFGYQRVILIGMDFSYTIPDDAKRTGNLILSASDDPNHFHPDYFGVGKTWKDPKLDRVLANYRLADEVYRATGREIINATVGGRLEVFPRMPLQEALDL